MSKVDFLFTECEKTEVRKQSRMQKTSWNAKNYPKHCTLEWCHMIPIINEINFGGYILV